jgi:inner membrane protein
LDRGRVVATVHEEGHVGVALLLVAPVAFVGAALGLLVTTGLATAGVVAVCTLPDLDLRVPFVTHRGITHTYLAALVAGVVGAGAGAVLAGAGVGATDAGAVRLGSPLLARAGGALVGFGVGAGGVLAHLAGDVLTPMGITPGYPLHARRYTLDLFRADNQFANGGLLLLGAVAWVAAVAGGSYLRTGGALPGV